MTEQTQSEPAAEQPVVAAIRIQAKVPWGTPADASPGWEISPTEYARVAADLVGKPVRINYQGDPVGTVAEAQIVDDALDVSVDVVDPQMAKTISDVSYGFSMAMHNRNPSSEVFKMADKLVMGESWTPVELGVFKTVASSE